jgi:Rieske Fe-S protein
MSDSQTPSSDLEPLVPQAEETAAPTDRRTFLRASSLAMAGGLAAGYGTLGYMAGRFLYPSQPQQRIWLFVAEVDRLQVGKVFPYRTPAGQTISITRREEEGTVEDFLALSSTCPHLGCQVHWEPANTRFFCPCHNGVFDPEGKATEGPRRTRTCRFLTILCVSTRACSSSRCLFPLWDERSRKMSWHP